MIDTMPKRHPRDRVIILLSTKRRKVEKEDPCPDLKLEKEVDDLESISGTSENHVVEEEGPVVPNVLEYAFIPVDEVDAEVIPESKPTISFGESIAETDIFEFAADPPIQATPIIKDEIRQGHELEPAAQEATAPPDGEGPLTPDDETTSEIIIPDIPLARECTTEQPATPISMTPTDIPAELDAPNVIQQGPTSIRSDSPLSSIFEISPTPPPRQTKTKLNTKKPRVKEEPADDDHLDTSPPEFATLTPHGLGEVTTQINNHFVYLFYRFCAERHNMTVLRGEGVARDSLTEDECMRKERVGNVYRELDPSSKRLVDDIIAKGDQANEEICFRVFLYSGFYLDETYFALTDGLGEIPSWKNFDLDKYEAILCERSIIQKKVIYTSAFQLVPPTIYYGRNLPHFAATLRFIMTLMECGLPQKLLECKYAVDASPILQTFPTLGGFSAQNIMISLNDASTLNFQYRTFATCGPGSRSYLQRIFGREVINHVAMEQAGLKWLYDNQWRYWARIGVDPPHGWEIEKGIRPGTRVLDIENALCWCHRYVNAYQRKGYKSMADIPPPTYDPAITESASMPAWCDEEFQITSSNRASFIGDYEEESQKLSDLEEEEGVFEIEKVICRKGMRTDKDGLFRVRWKGYPPEDDTWERGSSLKEGAEDVLKEWLEWEGNVWATIARITKENPYTRPWPGMKMKVEPKEEKPDPDAAAGTPGVGSGVKRGRRTGTSAGPSTGTKRPRQEEVVKAEP